MTQQEKDSYIKNARVAIAKAGLELASVIPDDDYIEAFCPRCKSIIIFHQVELDRVHCYTCLKTKLHDLSSWAFEKESERLVTHAGFEIEELNYDEDLIVVSCPQCESTTSFHFSELNHIYCRSCRIHRTAEESNFVFYSDYSNGYAVDAEVPVYSMILSWLQANGSEPAVLQCKQCGRPQLVDLDSSTIIEDIQNFKCVCGMITEEMRNIAARQGFSIETISAPNGDTLLQNDEICCICNRCGRETVLDLNAADYWDKLETLVCNCSDYSSEKDYIGLTKSGQMMWCSELLYVLSASQPASVNSTEIVPGLYMRYPHSGPRSMFFAADPNDEYHALGFFVFHNENDAWRRKYLLIRFDVTDWGWPQSGELETNVEIIFKWPHFYEELYSVIRRNILSASGITPASVSTYDRYITAFYTILNGNKLLQHFPLGQLRGLLSRQRSESDEIVEIEDLSFEQFLNMHSCPVCHLSYRSTDTYCINCNFDDLNRVFINESEARQWKRVVLEPYKQKFEQGQNS